MIPRHEYDQNYVPIPDAPQGSMIAVERLPAEVVDALRVCRTYEAESAVRTGLLADPVRAFFRWEQREADALEGTEQT